MRLELINDRYEFLKPEYATEFSTGADLKTAIDFTLCAGERKLIPTGLKLAGTPTPGVDIQIRARSGLAKNYGIMLANGVGTIDADYKDEICVLLYNSGQDDAYFKIGERIAQVVISVYERFENVNVKATVRSGGFGSTGT